MGTAEPGRSQAGRPVTDAMGQSARDRSSFFPHTRCWRRYDIPFGHGDDVAGHDLLNRERLQNPIPDDSGDRRRHGAKAVERTLQPPLQDQACDG